MKKNAETLARKWLSTWDHASEWTITGIEEVAGVTVAFYARKDGALVAGNSPLIGECESGKVITTGTAMPLDYYIRNYRLVGDPHVEPVECVRLSGSTGSLTAVSAARVLCGFAQKGILEAKEIADHVRAGLPAFVSPTESVSCTRLLELVRDAGFEADIVFLDPKKTGMSQQKEPTHNAMPAASPTAK